MTATNGVEEADRQALERQANLSKVTSHPIRILALTILNQRVASPVEIAREIGEHPAKVAYHIREILRFGFIEEVDRRAVRGAIEHFYRATEKAYVSESDYANMPANVRDAWIGQLNDDVHRDVRRALESPEGARRPGHQWWRHNLTVDNQGWDEIGELTATYLAEVAAAQDRALKRIADGEATIVRAGHATLLYETP